MHQVHPPYPWTQTLTCRDSPRQISLHTQVHNSSFEHKQNTSRPSPTPPLITSCVMECEAGGCELDGYEAARRDEMASSRAAHPTAGRSKGTKASVYFLILSYVCSQEEARRTSKARWDNISGADLTFLLLLVMTMTCPRCHILYVDQYPQRVHHNLLLKAASLLQWPHFW